MIINVKIGRKRGGHSMERERERERERILPEEFFKETLRAVGYSYI